MQKKIETDAARDIQRCAWVKPEDPLYCKYHDTEWGVHSKDDRHLFEHIVLESAQAGLSWITILRKRENYRKLFANFDANRIASFTETYVDELLKNPGIIRNRAKILAAISNAKCFLEIQKEFGSFYAYSMTFLEGGIPKLNARKTIADLPSVTEEAKLFAADLKKRGFKFLGPTTIYAHMQAVGMVNDHTINCFRYAQLTSKTSY